MEKVTLEDGQSADIVAGNIEKLMELFPDAIKEGAVDFEVLRQLLGDASVLNEDDEKYGLSWHGKKAARQIALTPSTGTLLPREDQSVDWDTTQNLAIAGDNLEALKLLQKPYANKIKVIYIDPPYNTGKEFIYPDKFRDNLQTYLRYTSQIDGEGMKLSSNTEAGGRKHTNWLNMMYPRLRVARNLLSSDGYIFISIGEDEIGNLRKLCDEVFGEENFVATFIWDGGRKNDSKKVSISHEYILVYGRSLGAIDSEGDPTLWRERKAGVDDIYAALEAGKKKFGDDWSKVSKHLQEFYRGLSHDHPAKSHEHYRFADENGVYFASDLSGPDDGRKNRPRYEVLHPVTGKPVTIPSRGWRWEEPRMRSEVAANRVHFGPDESSIPNGKVYLRENEWQAPSSVFYKDRRAASGALKKLMSEKVFDFPKDVNVLAKLVSLVARDGDIALDFFSGSGSFAEAVLRHNEEKNASLRYIVVQLPEPLEEGTRAWNLGYRTIFDIAVDRIRKVGESKREANPDTDQDLGFRAFELADSNLQVWSPDRLDIEGSLLASQDHLKEGRSQNDILFELLLKRGIDLATPIETRAISEKPVHSIGFGVLFACLSGSVKRSEVDSLAQGILDWHKELEPETDTHVFFRDSAFEDDIAKTNMAAILEQNGITHVRSL
ncbi:DNA methylase N-4 [Erythrobacter sp. HI0019]|uniref:site-specific DNA-methyltransferase n=1 Tax=unclassified Erythrobacter TaxID=2633097 RepID=UPI0007BABABE|nr:MULTISPECIES: site-specific DNA-methyltransferase [unclassified Erythrobacter]KZX93032.1 DNA methylase N-4 [Erythrobacter sp. HI0019]KZY09571.1 DNA methylase N-4 [Erythrobacter sp. HI0028]